MKYYSEVTKCFTVNVNNQHIEQSNGLRKCGEDILLKNVSFVKKQYKDSDFFCHTS